MGLSLEQWKSILPPNVYAQLAEKYNASTNRNQTPDTPSYVELPTGNEPVGEKKGPRFYSQVRIRIHSIRARLADSDGISGKAAIDGLVHCGVLANDTAKEVLSVEYSQSKGEPEETIITVEEI